MSKDTMEEIKNIVCENSLNSRHKIIYSSELSETLKKFNIKMDILPMTMLSEKNDDGVGFTFQDGNCMKLCRLTKDKKQVS